MAVRLSRIKSEAIPKMVHSILSKPFKEGLEEWLSCHRYWLLLGRTWHLHDGSQTPVTTVPGDPTPFLASAGTRHRCGVSPSVIKMILNKTKCFRSIKPGHHVLCGILPATWQPPARTLEAPEHAGPTKWIFRVFCKYLISLSWILGLRLTQRTIYMCKFTIC